MNLDIQYYFAVFIRRFFFFFLTFATVTAAAVTTAFMIVPSYESEARLQVESSRIPDELAAPTVTTSAREQLQIIEQRLITRDNMLDIARRFNVFPNVRSMTPDEIVEEMRRNTQIHSNAGYEQATLMTVRFEASRGETAAAVVNEYVTLILRDNVSIRTDRAQDTLEFFQQEVDRLAVEVSNVNARILEFQNTNADALPETLEFRLEQRANLQDRLAITEREISALKDQKRRLIQLYNSTGRLESAIVDTRTSEARQLDALEEELDAALAIYSPENPKVVLLKARIAALEKTVERQGPAVPQDTAPAEKLTLLDIQNAEIDGRIDLQSQQRNQIIADLDEMTGSIDRTATNSIVLNGLEREYDNVQSQYDTAVDRMAKASTGERIEVLSKGQRIAILDAPTVPDSPTKPNKFKIAVGGTALGLGLGVGLVVLLELLNGAIRRPTDLVRHLEITPIGAIPFVRTKGEAIRRRLVIAAALCVVLIGLPALLYVVHVHYFPLDLVINKIAAKVGL